MVAPPLQHSRQGQNSPITLYPAATSPKLRPFAFSRPSTAEHSLSVRKHPATSLAIHLHFCSHRSTPAQDSDGEEADRGGLKGYQQGCGEQIGADFPQNVETKTGQEGGTELGPDEVKSGSFAHLEEYLVKPNFLIPN